MLHGLRAHFHTLPLGVGFMREGHWDHVAARDFVDRCQEGPGENSVIRAYPTDKICKDHTIDHAMRVVGHHDSRPFAGNTVELFLRGGKLNLHDVEGRAPERLPCGHAPLLELAGHPEDGKFARHQFDPLDHGRLPRAVEGRSIGQAAPVVLERRVLRRCVGHVRADRSRCIVHRHERTLLAMGPRWLRTLPRTCPRQGPGALRPKPLRQGRRFALRSRCPGLQPASEAP